MGYDPFSCDDVPGQVALSSQDADTGRAAILLCPLAFQPPFPESLDSILDNHCNTIGDNADVDMDVPGGTIIHELLHWGIMSVALGEDYWYPDDGWILDWNDRQNPSFDPKQNPPNDYGPYVSNLSFGCRCEHTVYP